MALRLLAVFITGAWASNTTTIPPTTTPVPKVACTILTTPTGMISPGNQDPTCCASFSSLTSYIVLTNADYANYKSLVTGCMGMPSAAAPTVKRCVNETALDWTPSTAANGDAVYYACTTPTCVGDWTRGLYDNAGTLNAVMRPTNYTAYCADTAIPLFQANAATMGSFGSNAVPGYGGYTGTQLQAVLLGKVTAMQAQLDNIEAALAAAHASYTTGPPTTTVASTATTTGASSTATTTGASSAATTTITASLTVAFTVPANATAASLNSNAGFKTAMAKSIKASLTNLPTSATVSITSIAAGRRALAIAMRRSLASLDLVINYEITLPTTAADAVYLEIKDSGETFAAAVKTNSVAELSSGGFTGYAVDSVTAAAPTMANPPTAATGTTTAASAVLDDAASGAVSVVSGALSASAAMLLFSQLF